MGPIPVTVRSKAWVFVRSVAGIVGLNPDVDMDVCLSSVLCCHGEIFASG